MGIKSFFLKAFTDMKENAKAQHEVDKAEFAAAKAEAKAHFEENRGHNTYKKAKAIGRQQIQELLSRYEAESRNCDGTSR